jgi:hypothetical protein|tara:strand:- start:1166 stop:1387 length:222 start_codon:yes stop_codon:yes gene_type:complete
MTSLSIKEYNQDIDYKVEKIKAMRTIAKEVTLTEFIEQYPRHDYVALGSLWYSVNDDMSYEEAIKYVGGTDPE